MSAAPGRGKPGTDGHGRGCIVPPTISLHPKAPSQGAAVRAAAQGAAQQRVREHFSRAIRISDLRMAIELPLGEDPKEWVATNLVDFFRLTSTFYSTLANHCTHESCPVMQAGPRYQYLWADGVSVTTPVQLSAPEYMARLFEWTRELMSIIPVQPDQPFPLAFPRVARKIFRRLARVYAHVYYAHFQDVCAMHIEIHLHTLFMHFILFCRQFKLLADVDEAPLKELIDTFVQAKE